jgi:hypothetical protein
MPSIISNEQALIANDIRSGPAGQQRAPLSSVTSPTADAAPPGPVGNPERSGHISSVEEKKLTVQLHDP